MNSSISSRKLLSIVLALPALVSCLAHDELSQAQTMDSAAVQLQGNAVHMGDWVIGCNNMNFCTAIVPVREHNTGLEHAHLRIVFIRNFAAAPRLLIQRDGAIVENLSVAEAAKLMVALTDASNGDAILLSTASTSYDVPSRGFAAAMTAQQIWQDTSLQQFSVPETITPLPAVLLHTFVVPPKLIRAAKRCLEEQMGEPVQAWRLISGAILWRVGCGDERLNSVSYWFVSGPQGTPPVPIEFDVRPGSVDIFNGEFDAQTGYFRMIHYFGGQAIHKYDDCGIYRAYAWHGGKMKLIEQRLMPVCGTGIEPADWIITYHAILLNGSDSGP